MDNGIKQLVEISRIFGGDPSYVIAGGGNTSYKNEEKIWIKASGISLATIDESGFVCLSREKLAVISHKEYSEDPLLRENEVKSDLYEAIVSSKELRPSVETSLHELIGYQFVVHTHPTKVNGVMCSQQAEEVCKSLFGHNALFVPYTDPGYILFKKVGQGIREFEKIRGFEPQIIFLENHGVFVGADTTDEIDFIYSQIMTKIDGKLVNQLPCNKKSELHSVLIDQVESLHPGYAGFAALGFQSDLHKRFVANEDMFKRANKSFTPDDIVYCKAHYLYIPSQTTKEETLKFATVKIAAYYHTYGYLPKVLALQGQGIIGVEDSLKSVRNVLDVYENILKISFYTENFGGPKFLNDEQIAFIDNWEVENYRRKMAKS